MCARRPPAWPRGKRGSRSRTRSWPCSVSTRLFTERPLLLARGPRAASGHSSKPEWGRGAARLGGGGVCSLQPARSPSSRQCGTPDGSGSYRLTRLSAGITLRRRGGDRETSPTQGHDEGEGPPMPRTGQKSAPGREQRPALLNAPGPGGKGPSPSLPRPSTGVHALARRLRGDAGGTERAPAQTSEEGLGGGRSADPV